MWLAVPAGQRTIERNKQEVIETLYTIERFSSLPDLRKSLEARELDATNAKGILLFRTDSIPIETKMKAQVVIKFGHDNTDDEVENENSESTEEGMV
jgi:hypothetical protein